jgi:hypothetical protein
MKNDAECDVVEGVGGRMSIQQYVVMYDDGERQTFVNAISGGGSRRLDNNQQQSSIKQTEDGGCYTYIVFKHTSEWHPLSVPSSTVHQVVHSDESFRIRIRDTATRALFLSQELSFSLFLSADGMYVHGDVFHSWSERYDQILVAV